MIDNRINCATIWGTALLLTMSANTHAETIDWGKVKSKEITLFYPGQASWEWLLTEHSAAKSVRKGSPCLECHDGEEKQMGATIVKGAKLEPNPTKGKPGSITLTVQMAHDKDNYYMHLQWDDPNFRSGKKTDPDYETKLAVMIDDGSLKESAVAGCFAVCHDDATDMPSHSGSKERPLYLSVSREKITRTGGGDQYKSKEELNELFTKGQFMELWQIKLNPNQQPVIDEGYIMERRHIDNTQHVEASYDNRNGRWMLQLRRPLDAKSPAHKVFQSGKKYTIGFAIHDDYVKGRNHYVSFVRSFTFDGQSGDFQVSKQ